MTPQQVKMARSMLRWSLADLGKAARVGLESISDLEQGRAVSPWTIAAVKAAFAAQHVSFLENGAFAGGVLRSRIRYFYRTQAPAAPGQAVSRKTD